MMRTTSFARAASWVVALSALSACGPSAAEKQAAADSAAAAAEQARQDSIQSAPHLTACDLISTADLTRISGLELKEGQLMGDFQGVSQCRWDQPNVEASNSGWTISLRQPGDIATYSSVPGAAPVSGLGDEAYWNPNTSQMALRLGTSVASVALLVDGQKEKWTRQVSDIIVKKLAEGPAVP